MSAGQGSTGNVIAALASFFIPGLGQLIQGRPLRALVFFVSAALLWLIWMGWIMHIWSTIDAALWKSRRHRTIIDLAALPPYRLYQAVSKRELSAEAAADKWKHHLQDESWPAEWLLHLNAKIQQLAQEPGPSPTLVDWATIQVAAARYTGDADLLTQALATAGGVVLLITHDTEPGLAYQIAAIETSIVGSDMNRGAVVSAAAQTFANNFSTLRIPLLRPSILWASNLLKR